MGFKEVSNVVFCAEKGCRKVYEWDRKEECGDIRHGTILPCGHPISTVIFSGSVVKKGYVALDLLEWLDRNDAIKDKAFGLMEAHGGKFDDGMNFSVPEDDLTEDERREMER